MRAGEVLVSVILALLELKRAERRHAMIVSPVFIFSVRGFLPMTWILGVLVGLQTTSIPQVWAVFLSFLPQKGQQKMMQNHYTPSDGVGNVRCSVLSPAHDPFYCLPCLQKLTPVFPWEVERVKPFLVTLVDDLMDRMKVIHVLKSAVGNFHCCHRMIVSKISVEPCEYEGAMRVEIETSCETPKT